MTKLIHLQTRSAAAGTKELTAVLAEMKLHETKSDFPGVTLNMSWKKVAAKNGVVKKQRAQLEALGARMVASRHSQDEGSARAARCRKKLVQVQKHLAPAFEKMKASLALAVAMKEA